MSRWKLDVVRAIGGGIGARPSERGNLRADDRQASGPTQKHARAAVENDGGWLQGARLRRPWIVRAEDRGPPERISELHLPARRKRMSGDVVG